MSAKSFWVSQDGHLCQLIPPASKSAAVAAVRFNMAQWNHASILLTLGASGGPIGAITLNVYSALTGGSGVAIPYRLVKFENASAPYDVPTNNSATNSSIFNVAATGYTPGTDEADAMYILEVEAADLLAAANGTYVELDIAVGSMGTTAQLMSATAVLSGGRITGDQTATAQQ